VNPVAAPVNPNVRFVIKLRIALCFLPLLLATELLACSCIAWTDEDEMYQWVIERADMIFIGYPEVWGHSWNDGPNGRERVQTIEWSRVLHLKAQADASDPVITQGHPLQCGYIVMERVPHLVVANIDESGEIQLGRCLYSGPVRERVPFIRYLEKVGILRNPHLPKFPGLSRLTNLTMASTRTPVNPAPVNPNVRCYGKVDTQTIGDLQYDGLWTSFCATSRSTGIAVPGDN